LSLLALVDLHLLATVVREASQQLVLFLRLHDRGGGLRLPEKGCGDPGRVFKVAHRTASLFFADRYRCAYYVGWSV